MRRAVLGFAAAIAPLAAFASEPIATELPPDADIYLLGEIHDDARHHRRQGAIAKFLRPKALVFEMLPATLELDLSTVDTADLTALDMATGWTEFGWPGLEMYQQIFQASPNARVYGMALPRDEVRRAVGEGAAAVFGDEAEAYGLNEALPVDEQQAREQLQDDGHCNALPPEILPGFVEAQRLRDAAFARRTLEAFNAVGGPVVVITGNGHVRDWGMPAFFARVAPDLKVVALGQLYSDADVDAFTHAMLSPPIERDTDPCDAFK
ncbi:MAG: ChaN family lipoprotein [Litoreibacter sp.]|nr:ChaN family lipoprotein [Litoreibacter sp.]